MVFSNSVHIYGAVVALGRGLNRSLNQMERLLQWAVEHSDAQGFEESRKKMQQLVRANKE